MQIIRSIADLPDLRAAGGTIGLVPTMGALHEGHGSLITLARKDNDVVVVSDFVNPLQFGEEDDYLHYPRDLAADADLAGRYGADLLFAPDVEDMYPGGRPQISVTTGTMGAVLEGASRPGHFDGVATVVTKLFTLIRPHRAYFGEKDAQQLAIIRRMVADLNLGVGIVPAPIVRAADGLAESSRNRRLSPAERADALVLPRALRLLADGGTPEEARALVDANDNVSLDYLVVVDPADFTETTRRPALALGAMRVGPVRLIDNLWLGRS